MDIKKIADVLFEAEKNVEGCSPVTQIDPKMTIKDAYDIQLYNIERKLRAGRKIVGKKIGLTSLGMQKLLGVNEPDYGNILDNMLVENGAELNISSMVSPKVEAEIAFVLKDDLEGDVSLIETMSAIDYALPALEVVDSRVLDWKITLRDTVADNASSAYLVCGSAPFDIKDHNMINMGMYLTKNARLQSSGTGIEVMGNPVAAVAWLAKKLGEFGISLKKGEVVLSGAFTAAAAAHKNDFFEASFDRLGKVCVKFI